MIVSSLINQHTLWNILEKYKEGNIVDTPYKCPHDHEDNQQPLMSQIKL